MNVGLVARADDRGIGTMTWEFHKAMHPSRTLVVREPGAEARGFAAHADRYIGDWMLVTTFDPTTGELHEDDCRDFLDGLDVVYLVETPYDYRFFRWAREAGVATVLHAMPEFWRWETQTERPDVWWLPTSWRVDALPAECRVVEVPVPERPSALRVPSSEITFLHVAGHRAVGDRNGTLLLYQALRRVRTQCTVRICSQDTLPVMRAPAGVTIDMRPGGVVDRWSLYDDVDVLVMPRRYGGLSLPVLEAMASGLAVVLPNVAPNDEWPAFLVPARQGRTVEMPCGPIKLADTDPSALARTLDKLANAPHLVDYLSREAHSFARLHSWERLRPLYAAELARAVDVAAAGASA